MAAFNYRKLLREIPASTLRLYLEKRAITLPDAFNWEAPTQLLAESIITLLDTLDPAQQARLRSELRQVEELANRKGIDAMLNASNADPAMREDFEQLRNHAERALWVLFTWPETFQAARMLLQFDLGIGKRSWKALDIKVCAPVSRAEEDLLALRSALAELFIKRKGPRRACHLDLYDRHLDGGVQLSIYIEDDPNDALEFVDENMQLRHTRPAMSFDLVYVPARGIIDCVGRGGSKVQLPLARLFAKHLLKKDVTPQSIQQPVFYLNRLRDGFGLFDDGEVDFTAYQIDTVRLRKARLRSLDGPTCDYWIAPPVDKNKPDALACAHAHLKEHHFFRTSFNLVEAVVSIYFAQAEQHKSGRVLNIELRQSGISNLRDMEEADAHLSETLLQAWGVMPQAQSAIAQEPSDASVQ